MKGSNFYVLLCCLLALLPEMAQAQVAKTIVVEHFTNTRCGICSNRNPGFYQNLNQQNGIVHLAVHPSSPYSNCELNLHNPEENDGRTNFYGIYGSTPRLVIQGNVIPSSTNYSDAAIWNPYTAQTSPVSIQLQQSKQSNLIEARVTLTTEENNSLENLVLFLALAEDTVFYNAPNGEDLHFDVFREAVTSTGGMSVSLAANVGESVSFDFQITPDSEWDLNRMFLVAILQDGSDKEVIQAGATTPAQNDVILSNAALPKLQGVQLFPNPVGPELFITLADAQVSTVRIFDALGQVVLTQTFSQSARLDTSRLPMGTYFIEITNSKGQFSERLIRQ